MFINPFIQMVRQYLTKSKYHTFLALVIEVKPGLESGFIYIENTVEYTTTVHKDNQFVTPTTTYNAFWEFISPDRILHNLLMPDPLHLYSFRLKGIENRVGHL